MAYGVGYLGDRWVIAPMHSHLGHRATLDLNLLFLPSWGGALSEILPCTSFPARGAPELTPLWDVPACSTSRHVHTVYHPHWLVLSSTPRNPLGPDSHQGATARLLVCHSRYGKL